MPQAKATEILFKSALLFAVSAWALLGAVVTIGVTGNSRDPRAAGLMPEVVSNSALPRLVMDEIIVRAPRPDRLAGATVRLSGINQ